MTHYQPTADDLALFRRYYPAFASVEQWPDERVAMALEMAYEETGGRGWGAYEDGTLNFKMQGMMAYAAHWLLADYNLTLAGNNPSTPYPVASRTVRDESVSFAVPTPPTAESPGDTLLALTPYGLEFLKLRLRAGMGARAV